LESFAKKHGLKRLAYYEGCNRIDKRYKQREIIKSLVKKRNIKLIEDCNKGWSNL
jgi:predicted GIY-YIG superfamily endonuclease